ncbi:superoxide dismutase family protein [Enterobacillus tribolii]|uniref:Superoxide dismutase [Cu-Zn] n=1 Tax=Enterobacillus tribolii TaxID=1487935 RepID=A0A370R3U9_9GAMM|nr:superoxide dismutase family protein [Enterobacillus tribolii]MBW7984369.1 superoxide dismutase [Cu-Zn] SodC2 [Enterobacillus tribolii]RDK97108.1 Cu-Zn family superoxide dismutase [Enterobacillus tribolii]
MKKTILATALLCCGIAHAATQEVTLNQVTDQGIGASVGTITISETPYGLLFTPHLSGLPAGVHGFHVHENPSCDTAMKDGKPVAALAAGGHFDPAKTGKHTGPYDANGHLGDLPAVYADDKGNVTYPVLAPRLKTLKDVEGRSLMVHVGGDNHADDPAPLGGGGARMACGVIGG